MSKIKQNKPILAITMGDPAGIGPEIAAKTFGRRKIFDECNPVLIGHQQSMLDALDLLDSKLKLNVISKITEARFEHGTIDLIEVAPVIESEIHYGKVSALAGDIGFRAITTAIDMALNKQVDGTVTGPIQKEAINLAGHHFSGHTEIYAHYTHTSKYAMLLVDDNIKVIHATTHVSLRQACDLVKKDRILEVIYLLFDGLLKLGMKHPRIGVAGLNPHAGDGGLFGSEERDEIIPAIEEAKTKGINIDGPVPADTLFAMARGGKYDACVAMYHDQGHIPFKLLGFDWDERKNRMKSVRGVNLTLGLPIIRTSVDHGTAFEIAGKGIASPDALVHAIEYAIKLAN